ncbi:MAG: hypothetical protein H0W83_02775 [Planctomycetes bacterium]|nr:hypothetical protein [Planctomycetota bacterium]
MATPRCIPDIIAEHLDELPFDCGRRASIRCSRVHVLADLERLDERIAGRLDGLALGGTDALDGALSLLEGSDPEHRMAGALIAAMLDTSAAWNAVRAAADIDPATLSESLTLIGVMPPERLVADWTAGDAGLRLIPLELAIRRRGVVSMPPDLLAHQDPAIRARAWRSASSGDLGAGIPSSSAPQAVRTAALSSAAWNGWQGLLEHCRRSCRGGSVDRIPEMLMLSALAEPGDDDLLWSSCADATLGRHRFELAARWGRPLVAPLLIDAMTSIDRDGAIAAGEAFTHLFGIDLPADSAPGDGQPVSSGDGDVDGPASRPDADRARSHWEHVRPRLERVPRIIRGLDAATIAFEDLDMESRDDALVRSVRAGTGSDRWEVMRLRASLCRQRHSTPANASHA